MDGVLIRGQQVIPGAPEFINRLDERGAKYVVLTNNPIYTPGDLSHRLKGIGINITPEHIFTSALATARFLKSQHDNGTAYVMGESGLTSALHEVDFILTDTAPDYVVLWRNSWLQSGGDYQGNPSCIRGGRISSPPIPMRRDREIMASFPLVARWPPLSKRPPVALRSLSANPIR